MELITLEAIVSLKESSQVEYKKAKNDFPKDAWKSYSAFANTTGGYLILGVSEDENKKPVLTGVNDAEKIISDFCSTLADRSKVSLNIIKNDDIRIRVIEDKTIIILHIKEANIKNKPVYLNNNITHTYIRLHSQDHQVDTQQLRSILRNQSDELDYELLLNYDISDLDIDSINSYRAMLAKRYPTLNYAEMDNQKFLEDIGVFRKNRDTSLMNLTVAGLESDLERTYLKLWVAEPLVDISNLKEDERKVYGFICNNQNTNKSSIEFTKKEIADAYPEISAARLTRILNKLSDQNLILKRGAYKNRTYVRPISSLEMIHRFGETYDIIKHIFYKDKSNS